MLLRGYFIVKALIKKDEIVAVSGNVDFVKSEWRESIEMLYSKYDKATSSWVLSKVICDTSSIVLDLYNLVSLLKTRTWIVLMKNGNRLKCDNAEIFATTPTGSRRPVNQGSVPISVISKSQMSVNMVMGYEYAKRYFASNNIFYLKKDNPTSTGLKYINVREWLATKKSSTSFSNVGYSLSLDYPRVYTSKLLDYLDYFCTLRSSYFSESKGAYLRKLISGDLDSYGASGGQFHLTRLVDAMDRFIFSDMSTEDRIAIFKKYGLGGYAVDSSVSAKKPDDGKNKTTKVLKALK